jgi:capsular exopolysaccharide synthesis family protein
VRKPLLLQELAQVILKRRYIVLCVFLGAVVSTWTISSLTVPTYQTESTVRIKPSKGLDNSLLSAETTNTDTINKPLISTYAEIIKSRSVIDAAIQKMEVSGYKGITYENVVGRISIQPVKETELLKIKVQSQSPAEAQVLANTLVATFNERINFLSRSEDKRVKEFIGERLQESQKELERAEDELKQYKLDQHMIAPSEETKALVERLSTINQTSAKNTIELVAAQAKVAKVNQQLSSEGNGFIADNQLIEHLKNKLADLEVEKVNLSQKYTDEHPKVMAVRAMVLETRTKLNDEITKVIEMESSSSNPVHQKLLQSKANAEMDMAAVMAPRQAINKILAEDKKKLDELPLKEQGLAKVMRQVAVAQEVCLMLAKRYEEARISEVMQPTDIQVVDWAVVPSQPIKPQKKTNVMVAALLGLIGGLVSAAGVEYVNKTIHGSRDVNRYLGLPVLGKIPAIPSDASVKPKFAWQPLNWLLGRSKEGEVSEDIAEKKPWLVVREEPRSQAAEAYRALGNSLQFSKTDRNVKSIMIVGLNLGEEKSIMVANLAIILAQANKKIAILDLNLRRPIQHKIFGVKNLGVTNIFIEGALLSDMMQSVGNSNLELLSGGPFYPNASDLLWNIDKFVNDFKKKYDYILIDVPPVLAVTDACLLAGKVDSVILAMDAGKEKPEVAQKGKDLIVKAGGRLMGVILDRVENKVEQVYYRQYHSETI